MAEIGNDIHRAKLLLEKGDVIGIPTETVYGLAGNALDESAVLEIFKVKERPSFDPLIVHVTGIDAIEKYVVDVPVQAQLLAKAFWPGPLTLLLEKKPIIPDLVTSGLSTVGIRCPDHSLTQSLLSALEFPLAAPSANPFGYVSPTTSQHVNDQLGEKIKYILDGGACRVGIESTIVGFENGNTIVYRLGGVDISAIEKIVGVVQVQPNASSNPKAPGQLKSHYAPGVKLIIGKLEELLQEYSAHTSGLLSFSRDFNTPYQFILSPLGSMEEAAHNLFAALRYFDTLPVEVVLAEFVPEIGLGRAINDRLRRASSRDCHES
jgi:L-threonylcarbamoyladenylate synthase